MLSRLAKLPISIPTGVDIEVKDSTITVKGPLGQLQNCFNNIVGLTINDSKVFIATNADTKFAKAMSGTAYALISNMILGVTKGFEKKLTILGVGYRAIMQGDSLSLSLGYSHPIIYKAPAGIKISVNNQTEITIKGIAKEVVGQVAAVIRAYRKVEYYKGKGIRYANETVILKETKKK